MVQTQIKTDDSNNSMLDMGFLLLSSLTEFILETEMHCWRKFQIRSYSETVPEREMGNIQFVLEPIEER